MKDKILFSVIGFLILVIIIITIKNERAIEANVEEDNDTEYINIIKKLEDEVILLERELLKFESENIKITERLSKFSNGIVNSGISSFFLAVLEDIEVDGVLLKITYNYAEVCEECEHGFKLIPEWSLIKRTISVNDYAPIFMYSKQNNLEQVDWEYLINLDYSPILEIYEDREGVHLIKEWYQLDEPWRKD